MKIRRGHDVVTPKPIEHMIADILRPAINPNAPYAKAMIARIVDLCEPRGVRALSWNRTAPFPPGLDFRTEALAKLREQITPEMVEWRVSEAVAPTFPDDAGRPEIHRAILRVV